MASSQRYDQKREKMLMREPTLGSPTLGWSLVTSKRLAGYTRYKNTILKVIYIYIYNPCFNMLKGPPSPPFGHLCIVESYPPPSVLLRSFL